MATQVMSIRIPQEVHDWLRERAHAERRSINQIVSEVLAAAAYVKVVSIGEFSETRVTPETR